MGSRVLITSPEGLGHIHPMVPLARAMAARGHDALWAVPANGVAHVERAGIRAVATAGVTDLADVLRRHPELKALSPRDRPEAMFGKLFGTIATAMLPDVTRIATEWRPDLVVADAGEFAGHIAAAELGVPSVTKGFGPLLPERRVATIEDEVAPLWRSRGLEPRPYGGSYDHVYLDTYPPRSSRRHRRTSSAVSCYVPSRTTGSPARRRRCHCPPARLTHRSSTSRWARCSTTRRRSSQSSPG